MPAREHTPQLEVMRMGGVHITFECDVRTSVSTGLTRAGWRL